MNQRGFTLIEVLIAVTLMAFLSFFTATSISKALKAKDKIQNQVDRNAEVRDVLNFMTRDIELAFNYRDIDIELYNKAIAAGASGPASGAVPTPSREPKQDKVVTQFVGDSDKLDFSSLGNIRTQANEATSSQAEVGYYLDGCSGSKGKCLWRRLSPYIDDKISEGGTTTPLLRGVTSLSFRYLGPGFEEEWAKTWRSDGQGSETMKGSFPYAVEITIEAEDPKSKPARVLKISKVARIRFPNNPEKTNNDAATSGPAGGP